MPHPRSDVLVDRFIDDEDGFAQRGGETLVIGNRVLIHADGAMMPFRNSQFEYAIVSHVIEHIPPENIHQFVSELQRVALRGYVEAPSILYEAIRDTPEHFWYVVCERDTLHLCRKSSVSRWQPFFDPLFQDGDFCSAVERHADLFFTGEEWEGQINLSTHHDLREMFDLYPAGWARQIVSRNLMMAARSNPFWKKVVRQLTPPLLPRIGQWIFRRVASTIQRWTLRSRTIDWRDLVVCPYCHSDMQIDLDARRMACMGCNRKYTIREDGIPSFMGPYITG